MPKSNNSAKKIYYSYSRLWCYLRDPEEYYTKYVMGLWDPPNPKMLLGTIFSDAYSQREFSEKDPSLAYDWKLALKHPEKYYKSVPEGITYTLDYERKMNNALESQNMVQAKRKECEQTILLDLENLSLQAKNDAYVESKNLVIENKYGILWNEERVNTDDQLTFYSYVVFKKFGKIPIVRLQSVNSANGSVQAFEISKKEKEFEELEKKIMYAYNGIQKEIYD